MKRGLFFAVDAFLAAMVIVLGLVVASTFFINKASMTPLASLSSDLSGILSSVSVGGMKNEYLDVLRVSGVLSAEEEKYSLAEFVARLFSEGRKSEVALLMQNLTGSFIPENLNVQIIVDGEFAYATSNDSPRETVAARSMVTGIDVKKPLSGFISRAYVSGNASKKEVYYDSLSGSLGYGNVTKILRGLPGGISVQRLRVALFAANATRWFVNGVNCLNVSAGFQVVNTAACNARFGSGNDSLQILFPNASRSGVQVIRGGLIEINYTSNIAADHTAPASQRFYFDGVDGLINVKTGIYAKGDNPLVSAYLRWRNFGAGWDYDGDGDVDAQPMLLLRFGNRTVYETERSGVNGLWLDHSYLRQWYNIGSFQNTTMPVYFGYNGTEPGEVRGGVGDVVLATETSSSAGVDFWTFDEGEPGDCVSTGFFVDDQKEGSEFSIEPKHRLSYVKCGLQRMFDDLLSNEDSRVGLNNFDVILADTKVELTRNKALLVGVVGNDSPFVSGYGPSGVSDSCVCCAINDARDDLVAGVKRKVVVYNHSSWKYVTSSPPLDVQGRSWRDPLYDDSLWLTGTAVFGSGYVSGQLIRTDWGSSAGVGAFFPSLAEVLADQGSSQVEFTNGFSFSNNTFGVNGSVDGWDSQCGVYSSAQSCNSSSSYVWMNADPNLDGDQVNNSVRQFGELRTVYSNASSSPLGGDNRLLSAGFGVDFDVNASAMSILSSNGWATLKLKVRINQNIIGGLIPYWAAPYTIGDYDWHSIWIKARLGTNQSNMIYLGSDIDRQNRSRDITNELFWCMGYTPASPLYHFIEEELVEFTDVCRPLLFSIDIETNISNVISGIGTAGNYYLEFGSIINNSVRNSTLNVLSLSQDSWTISFDDIQILIANKTQEYYLRKNFSWSSPFNAEFGVVNVLSDDYASLWVNRHRVDMDTVAHSDQYWNRRGKVVKGSWLVNGSNVVAARVSNSNGQSKFDAEVSLLSSLRSRDVVVSFADSASVQCAEQNTGSASGDAVKAACSALEGWGVRTHVVGASPFMNASMIGAVSLCGGGYSFVPSDPDSLMSFYESLAQTITYDAQSLKDWTTIGALIWGKSVLYSDSFVEVNVTPSVATQVPGEIIIEKDLGVVSGCRARVTIPPKVRVVDSYVVNVPGGLVNNNVNVSLVNYYDWKVGGAGVNLTGSPQKVYVPFRSNDTFSVVQSMSPSGCSSYGKVQGKFAARVISDYSAVLPKNEGCEWRVMTANGNVVLRVPHNYTGSAKCKYFPGVPGVVYDVNSSVQVATADLLKKLDWDDDLRVDLDIPLIQVQLDTVSIPAIPYMWGPAIVEVRAWY